MDTCITTEKRENLIVHQHGIRSWFSQERQNVYIKHLKESSKQDRRKLKLDKTYTTNVRMLHHEPERTKLKSVLGISSNELTPSVNRIVIYTCGTYVGKDSGGIIVCYLS